MIIVANCDGYFLTPQSFRILVGVSGMAPSCYLVHGQVSTFSQLIIQPIIFQLAIIIIMSSISIWYTMSSMELPYFKKGCHAYMVSDGHRQ